MAVAVDRHRHAAGDRLADTVTVEIDVAGRAVHLERGARFDGGGEYRVQQSAMIARQNGHANGHASPTGQMNGNGNAGQDGGNAAGCTAPQLRRFIKSRPYVPMHELRRRFAIDGNDDDVTPVDLEGSKVYVGLPPREGSLLGELLRGGEIGYELSFDPLAPIVVGVYPMRPVPRT